MPWTHVRLELARTDTFPEGSSARGYDLVAPLDADFHLDEALWRQDKRRATVRRFWEGEDDEHGELIHTRHRTWAFSYEPGEEDDEPIFHLETHRLAPGEYVTITDPDGPARPFRVVKSAPLDPQP